MAAAASVVDDMVDGAAQTEPTPTWATGAGEEKEHESSHPYQDNTSDFFEIKCAGADELKITFDERTRLEGGCDFLKFFKDDSKGETWTPDYNEQKMTGRDNSRCFPGLDGKDPLIITADSFWLYFQTDGSVNDWGWKFKVEATFPAVDTSEDHWFPPLNAPQDVHAAEDDNTVSNDAWDLQTEVQKALDGDSGHPYRHSKIMLVGPGRAGKTALANSLAGVPFVETTSTIGLEANLTCTVNKMEAQGNFKHTAHKIVKKIFIITTISIEMDRYCHHRRYRRPRQHHHHTIPPQSPPPPPLPT